MQPLNPASDTHRTALRDALARPCYAVNFSKRKRKYAEQFLGVVRINAVRQLALVPTGSTALMWGMDCDGATPPTGVSVVRLEDGFIRSVGLGADLVAPISWVADTQGMYFDATRASSLETMLQTLDVDAVTLQRAANFRQSVVASGITKYNVGTASWQRPVNKKHVVLVAGQVQSDASIRYGTQHIKTNLALLQTVRKLRPQSHIVYKPHPDVTAGLRAGTHSDTATKAFFDEVLVDAAVPQLLNQVDEVHVMTSLIGFEALLRGVVVHTYGAPFYAGWGLTNDAGRSQRAFGRRTRSRSLDELLAIALLIYPLYVSPKTRESVSAEQALQLLQDQLQQAPLNGATASISRFTKSLLRPILAWAARLQRRF